MLNAMCKDCVRLEIDCQGTEKQLWSGFVYKENTQQALKRMLAELSQLEVIADKAEEEMVSEPENIEKEKAFDEAYKVEFSAFTKVAEFIVKATRGRIDEKTARAMVRTQRVKILELVV